MIISFSKASEKDLHEICQINNACADLLTEKFGKGHWSYHSSEKVLAMGLRAKNYLLVARKNNILAGSLLLGTKKPWAINVDYFTPVAKPLYLTGMAITPEEQRNGLGKAMIHKAIEIAREWPADAIRLDAYDNVAGAGNFYEKCGFTERGRVIYKGNPLIYFEFMV